MTKRITWRHIADGAVCAGLLAAAVFLVIFPAESVSAARSGVELCLNVIVPSLFPFFVLSSLTVRLGLADALGRLAEPVMRPLFGVGGACSCALVLGLIGGYPIGAKTVIELYENGVCSEAEAERLLAFCNNSGPAFILGVVGAGVFANGRAGLLLFFAHIASSLIVGLLFRFWRRREPPGRKSERPPAGAAQRRFAPAFTGAVVSSFSTMLSICGFVVFFTVVIKMLFLSGVIPALSALLAAALSPLGLDSGRAEKLITGAIELSSGVWSLKGAAVSMTAAMSMAAFMLGWAGLSVHCQVLSFLGGSGLSTRTYIAGKLLHGLVSAALVPALCRLFAFEEPAAAYLAEQVGGVAAHSFLPTAALSALCAAALFAVFLCTAKRKRPR